MVTIQEHGQLKEITIANRDLRDLSIIPHVEVFYKGRQVSKIQSITLLLAPVEQDPGNKELLDDLGIHS